MRHGLGGIQCFTAAHTQYRLAFVVFRQFGQTVDLLVSTLAAEGFKDTADFVFAQAVIHNIAHQLADKFISNHQRFFR